MAGYLRVTIDDIDLVLAEDTSIDIVMKNPYLNDGIETYTYQFSVPIDGNRALFADIDNPDSDFRLTSIEGHPMAIYISGVLFAHGKVAIIDEQTIVDKVDISMTSNKKQIGDLIGDITLQDLVFPDKDKPSLWIGQKIGDIGVMNGSTSRYGVHAQLYCESNPNIRLTYHETFGVTSNSTGVIQPQALGSSAPKKYKTLPGSIIDVDKPAVELDFINTAYAYNEQVPQAGNRRALYHNARISYIHYRRNADGESTDEVQIDSKGYGPYFVLDADRPQSGICFYLMYVIEVLFENLGIIYNDAPIAAVEDMKHLSFYTTLCKYDTERAYPDNPNPDFPYEKGFEQINRWLSARNIHGRLESGKELNDKNNDGTTFPISFYHTIYASQHVLSSDQYEEVGQIDGFYDEDRTYYLYGKLGTAETRVISQGAAYDITIVYLDNEERAEEYFRFNCNSVGLVNNAEDDNYKFCGNVLNMYANADNLPEMPVKSFLDSLWGSFGLRFYYDSESNVVTPYFIRDVLRNQTTHELYGRDISVHPIAEKITGVCIKYSAESDRIEQIQNIRKGVTDYDTRYDYLVDKTPAKNIDPSRSFLQFSRGTLSVGDFTLYVDRNTGNVYRIKINKEELDAGNIGALQPSMLQVAQFKGIQEMAVAFRDLTDAELQDPDIADFIQEIVSEFEPLVQNDLNYGRAVSADPSDAATLQKPLLCPFTDEDMWNETAGMGHIRNVVDSNAAYVHYIDEVLATEERYDVSGTDDGNSPLQHISWGNCITLMRGGGDDARIQHFERNYDFFGTEKWSKSSGTYLLDSDSINNYNGQIYDYNTGDVSGDGGGERISLSIRAYHNAPADLPDYGIDKGTRLCFNDNIANRGLADTFFAEYIYFLLNRKKLSIKTLCEISYLIDIHWRDKYAIAGHTGWLDSVSVKVSMISGIDAVEFIMFEL